MKRLLAMICCTLPGVVAAIAQTADGNRTAFKPAAFPNRAGVPYVERDDPDKGGNQSILDTVWMSLVWWELHKVLAPLEGANTRRRSEEIQKKLKALIEEAGVDTHFDHVEQGIQEFFAQEFKDLAVCRTYRDRRPTPAGLARYPKGADLVFLLLDRRTEKNDLPPVCLFLESMTPAGAFSLSGFGRHIRGQMKMHPDGSAEFMVANRNELPPRSQPEGVKFILHPGNVLVVRPYVFATPGIPAPLPADESFDFSGTPAPVLAGGRYVDRDIPAASFDFKATVMPPVSWTLADGKTVRATPVGRKLDKLQFRNEAGRLVEVPESRLSPQDRARFLFWEGSNAVALPGCLDLTYRLGIVGRDGVEIRITTDGTLGRVDAPGANASLIYDLRDGAYAKLDTTKKEIIERGRLSPTTLLRGDLALAEYEEKDMERFFERDLPQAKAAPTSSFPSRALKFSPVSPAEFKTFQQPSIDFVRFEATTALAAVFCLLQPWPPDERLMFNPNGDRVGVLKCEGVFKLLMKARVLPLALRWTNEGSEDIWSLVMMKASVPDGFAPDHFAIPPIAREMAVGTSN
jgi:hypothetical protein